MQKEKKVSTKLNISRLIQDLGGASAAAKITGTVRTAPYGWIARQYVSSAVLEKIKSHDPDLDLDAYFDEEKDEAKDKAGGRT